MRMTEWTAVIFGFSVEAAVEFRFPRLVAKGKLTKTSCRLIPWLRSYLPGVVRSKQILLLVSVYIPCTFADVLSGVSLYGVYWFWGGIAVLYIDDLITGDTDKWKRLWKAAKNKIKWKMKITAPVPVRGTS